MQRRLIPATVAALALAAAPAAGAKEISNAEVCGTAGACQTVDGEASRMALMTASGRSIAPPPRAPYYDVRAEYSHGDQHQWVSYVAVPRHRAVRYEDGAWYEMTAEQAALIRESTAGAEPYPAAGLIDAAPAPDPSPRGRQRRRQPAVARGRAAGARARRGRRVPDPPAQRRCAYSDARVATPRSGRTVIVTRWRPRRSFSEARRRRTVSRGALRAGAEAAHDLAAAPHDHAHPRADGHAVGDPERAVARPAEHRPLELELGERRAARAAVEAARRA